MPVCEQNTLFACGANVYVLAIDQQDNVPAK